MHQISSHKILRPIFTFILKLLMIFDLQKLHNVVYLLGKLDVINKDSYSL